METSAKAVLLRSISATWELIVIATSSQSKARRINIAVSEEQQDAESNLGSKIQNAVEDGLRVRSNHVASLADAPGNGVQEEDEEQPGTRETMCTGNIAADGSSVQTRRERPSVQDVAPDDNANGEVAPLVSGWDESTKEAAKDSGPRDDNIKCDMCPWQTRGEEELSEQKRCGDEPVNIARVEDLSQSAGNLWMVAHKFDRNRHETKVRSLREIIDCGDEQNGSGQVVEYAMSDWSDKAMCQSEERG